MPLDRPPRPARNSVDDVVRQAILRQARRLEGGELLSAKAIVARHCGAEYLADAGALLDDVATRYGTTIDDLFERIIEREKGDRTVETASDELVLLVLPDEEFLTALEHTAASMVDDPDQAAQLLSYAESALKAHGLPYKLGTDGRFDWVGERVVREHAVEPALHALADERLAGARDEFEDALGKRRAGGTANLKDAIHEAAKAVESTMKVVLEQRGVDLPSKSTAHALFLRLSDHGVVANFTESLLTAAAHLRNHLGGHGQGGEVVEVPAELADAAIGAAASAIIVLVGALPAR